MRLFATYWTVSNGGITLDGYAIAHDQNTANGVANARAAANAYVGSTSAIYEQAPIYMILSQAIIGATIAATIQSRDFGAWNTIVAQSDHYGLNMFDSPRRQDVYPWNGEAKRNLKEEWLEAFLRGLQQPRQRLPPPPPLGHA